MPGISRNDAEALLSLYIKNDRMLSHSYAS